MSGIKKRLHILNKPICQTAGILLLFVVAVFLCLSEAANDSNPVAAKCAQIYFEGEYRIGDGPWTQITEGQHISSTKGDVTLRGNFHMLTPVGEYAGPLEADIPVAFYMNHINITVCEGENEPYVMDTENPLYGKGVCEEAWTPYLFSGSGAEPVELIIHNPHRFGNENAVDALLENLAIWSGIDFEREILASGNAQRTIGMLLFISSIVLLGIALYSTLLHIQSSQLIWFMGLTTLFASVYFVTSSKGIYFSTSSVYSSTTLLILSLVFYMLFLAATFRRTLGKTKIVCGYAISIMGFADIILMALPLLSGVFIYDLLPVWVVLQSLFNLLFILLLILDFKDASRTGRWLHLLALLPMLSFPVDCLATALGYWQGGLLSVHVFILLFLVSILLVWRIIPQSINASVKAKDLELRNSLLISEKNAMETELKESRVAIMLSQIQPHFIYNTLGTIERLCLKDPQKAFELVRNFSLYLRGNFSELDSIAPIHFTDEIRHVQHYVNIEQVRFPDMRVEYDLQATNFVLPALSVQPLVENAIKHGLMRLESGGTVTIHSYETESHYCVAVTDDGAGFDPQALPEGKQHVGLRNISGRLKAIVNGALKVESTPGKGTKATILIPKEGVS